MPTQTHITLFAHFDQKNCIDTNTTIHLAALREVSTHLVFISNSPLPTTELNKIKPLVDEIIIQPNNIGFDFYAWASYMKPNREKITAFDALILVNSSVIGPLTPLQIIIDSMKNYEYWGMTESYQLQKHLQSYFLFFRKKITNSNHFWEFFDNIIPFPTINSVIYCYEISLTMYLEHFFGKPGVVATHSTTYKTYNVYKFMSFNKEMMSNNIDQFKHFGIFKYIRLKEWVNPTLFFPDKIITDGVPYVKVKLFTENPYNKNTLAIEKKLLSTGFEIP